MKLFREMLKKFKTLESQAKGVIYPQSVKEIFHISTGQAIFFLELAARAGHVKKIYQVRCPTCGRIMESYSYKYEIPDHLDCIAGDDHDEFDLNRHQKLIEKAYVVNA